LNRVWQVILKVKQVGSVLLSDETELRVVINDAKVNDFDSAGSVNCNWFDDDERVNDGSVAAKDETVINDANNKAAQTANASNFVFFIDPTRRTLKKSKRGS
jgi:uncharacterized protein YodC (DUF2158 family)